MRQSRKSHIYIGLLVGSLGAAGCMKEAGNQIHLEVTNVPSKATHLECAIDFDRRPASRGIPTIDLTDHTHPKYGTYSTLISFEIPLGWYGRIDVFLITKQDRCVLSVGSTSFQLDPEFTEQGTTYYVAKKQVDSMGNFNDYETELELQRYPHSCEQQLTE